jgi:hypothetical protein
VFVFVCLSRHTVPRILFRCTAKARFLGRGRGGSPTHAWIATTGSLRGRGYDGVFNSDFTRVRHRKMEFIATFAMFMGAATYADIMTHESP